MRQLIVLLILVAVSPFASAAEPGQPVPATRAGVLVERPVDALAMPGGQLANSSPPLRDPGPAAGAQAVGDTYSLAPIVETADSAFYLSPVSISDHTFTNSGAVESGGSNGGGSGALSAFEVRETLTDLGGGISRYAVEVRAVVSGSREPWVDSSLFSENFVGLRLDIGDFSGGSDPIEPGFVFVVINSGVNTFDTGGSSLPDGMIFDTSTFTGMSGVGLVSDGGENIAGYPLSAIEMFWDVADPPDLEIVSVDAVDGAYLPGATMRVFTRMKNNGSVTSGLAGVVSIYASTDSTITAGDRLIGSFTPDLDPGEEINYFFDTTIPVDLANGDYFIGVILDYPDSNTSNNSGHDPQTVKISDEPEIRVQPLTLDLVEKFVPPEQLNASSSSRSTIDTPAARTRLAALVEQARSRGTVRVIVGFDSGAQPEGRLSDTAKQDQRQLIENRGAALLSALQGMNYTQHARYRFIPYMALTVDEQALQTLAASPMVTSIEQDTVAKPYLDSSNNVIGSPAAWADGYDGAGQTIAILDTGVDKSHPWFSTGGSKVVTEACYSSNTAGTTSLCPGGVEESVAAGSGVHCSTAIGGCDHGTHVAGIAAGNVGSGARFGVARGADLAALQVFSLFTNAGDCGDDPAPCVRTFGSDQIKALERVYALRNTHDFAAVNMSLGGGRFFTSAACDAVNGARKAAIDNLRSVGIATVIASGNDGYVDSIGEPACISTAVSVGNSTDADTVAGSSNIYPELHLMAPGTSIISAVPGAGTGSKSGTSMATPHVAGAWAILKQANPDATVGEILAALQSTGTPIDDLREGGIETNLPRINVDLALGEARTSFSIFNEGPAELNITSITRETPAAWLDWSPQAPFTLQAGELKIVSLIVDFDSAPSGTTQTRLLINSNDTDESPYPGGVLVDVTPLPPGGTIIVDKETDPPGSGQSFDFTLSGAGVHQDFSLADGTTPHNSGELPPTSVNGIYSVVETMPPQWTSSGVSCSDGSPPTAIDLGSGETVTCTFMNSQVQEELIYEDGFEPAEIDP